MKSVGEKEESVEAITSSVIIKDYLEYKRWKNFREKKTDKTNSAAVAAEMITFFSSLGASLTC